MRQSGLKGVLENDSNPHRNILFNEPAHKRGPLQDSILAQHENNYLDIHDNNFEKKLGGKL